MYTELIINNKSYKLRLTTKTSIQLEKALGYNPLTMLMNIENGKLPTLNEMLIVLHAMLQAFNHGTSMDDVYDIYDDYVADGKTMLDLIPVYIEVFQNCGYIAKDNKGNSEKN